MKAFEYRASRFSRKRRRGPGRTSCIEWTAGRDTSGYGRTRIGRRWLAVHRAAWEAAYGPIPEGVLILHRCDNPPCFRLDHLFAGTQRDNILDAIAKGRLHRNKEGRFE